MLRDDGDAGALGIIGGSGLYDLDGLQDIQDLVEAPVNTPWGPPSAPPRVGQLGGRKVIFLPRHGRGHRYLPSEINYRANICALRQLGAGQVVAVSAVGSLREEIRPGDLVLVDQFIDRTHGRPSSFFGDGCVGHVAFADPVCAALSGQVAAGAEDAGLAPRRADAIEPSARGKPPHLVHVGGTYVCMEGPQFSTRAESLLHRSWGAVVVGMTGATEAKLCREAELCFSLLALATDYDCWHPEEDSVTAGAVLEVLRASTEVAKEVLRRTAPRLPGTRFCPCATAARHAVLTAADAMTPEARERLRVLYGRHVA